MHIFWKSRIKKINLKFDETFHYNSQNIEQKTHNRDFLHERNELKKKVSCTLNLIVQAMKIKILSLLWQFDDDEEAENYFLKRSTMRHY